MVIPTQDSICSTYAYADMREEFAVFCVLYKLESPYHRDIRLSRDEEHLPARPTPPPPGLLLVVYRIQSPLRFCTTGHTDRELLVVISSRRANHTKKDRNGCRGTPPETTHPHGVLMASCMHRPSLSNSGNPGTCHLNVIAYWHHQTLFTTPYRRPGPAACSLAARAGYFSWTWICVLVASA